MVLMLLVHNTGSQHWYTMVHTGNWFTSLVHTLTYTGANHKHTLATGAHTDILYFLYIG